MGRGESREDLRGSIGNIWWSRENLRGVEGGEGGREGSNGGRGYDMT